MPHMYYASEVRMHEKKSQLFESVRYFLANGSLKLDFSCRKILLKELDALLKERDKLKHISLTDFAENGLNISILPKF